MSRIRFFCLFFLLCVSTVLASGGGAYTPKPGDPERKAILDALRVPVEKELHQKVVFRVDWLKVKDGWALMYGVPVQPNGKPVDYRGTVYAQAIADGHFDNWICSLLRKPEKNWQVIIYEIGATDVSYGGWDIEYQAPADIFPEWARTEQ